MADCCSDFTRSQMLSRAAAQAGRGLPRIDAGMPEPAGTGMRRRTFLFAATGLALSVYGASRIGLRGFEEGIAAAADGGPGGPVLVSVFMPGGADSLSMLAPVGDPQYRVLRPTLAVNPAAVAPLRGDPRLGWAPSAKSLATLHGEGKVTVIPAVGYDNPDGSHFTSRHYWEVGETNASNQVGWLGRYLDATGSADNPLQGLALDNNLSPMLASQKVPVAALASPQAYGFSAPGVEDPVATRMLAASGALGALPTAAQDTQLAGARTVVAAAARLRGQLAPLSSPDGQPHYNSPVAYPPNSNFGASLAALAAMLAAGLPLRVVTVNADDADFDTHADQAQSLPARIQGVCDALLAFQRDIEARGLADRVLVELWSEFGRRPAENGSGTDHGAGGAAYVIGTRASGALIGEFPGLANLDDNDNLRATTDFRSVYCSLLEQWLGHDAASVIPGAASFARPPLVK
jgi:uncharacterized protein (DUF1501 family)